MNETSDSQPLAADQASPPAPAGEALPADSLPADSLPADSLPNDDLPVDGLATDGLPADGMTVDGMAAGEVLPGGQVMPEGMMLDPVTGDLIPDPNALPIDGAMVDGQGYGEFLNLILAGGPTMWLLALLSVIALGIIIAKLIEFYLVKIDNTRIEPGGVRSGQASLAQEMVLSLRDLDPEEHAEAAIDRQLEAVDRRLSRYLPGLAFIAGIAPLIGLFGTVLGMIAAFRAMEAAGSRVDPSILSGGIWEALLTTAGGLTVAIPAAIAHHLLAGRVASAVAAFEDLAYRSLRAIRQGGDRGGEKLGKREEERETGLRAAG